jgi:cellulose synthase/poly-beta-1,6-N-acetylglucosamine synthase-like glycosyltransferase
MRVSLIAAYYKDIVALKCIIESLKRQDHDDFELIVAEDNCDETVESYLRSITDFDIIHTSQEDIGNRKARSINNAILRSTGDYLIFIDADCIPYHNFISSHVKLAEKGHVLSGRRVNLGPRVSSLIRNNRLQASTLEKFYFLFMPFLSLDGGTHLEQGISLDPEGFIYRNMISGSKKRNVSLLGCNFSCFKKDMLDINGFDESYPGLGKSVLKEIWE